MPLLTLALSLSLAEPLELAAERGEHETDNGLSARVLGGSTIIGEERVLLYGGGVAYERDFFHGLVAVELAAEGLIAGDDAALLFELVVEKPIELGDSAALYFGGGPTAVVHFEGGAEAAPGFGGLALIGVELEIIERWELFVELDTAFLFVEAPIVEADVGTGVLWRF